MSEFYDVWFPALVILGIVLGLIFGDSLRPNQGND